MPDSQSATVDASEAAPETPGMDAAAGSGRSLVMGTQEDITKKLLLCLLKLVKSIDPLEQRTTKAENKENQTAPPDASATPVPEASTPNPDGGRFNHIRVLAIVIVLGSAAPAFSEENVGVGSVRRFFVWPVIFGAIAAIALWRVAETKKTFKRGTPGGLTLTKTDPDGTGRISMLKSSLEGRQWLAEATREIEKNYGDLIKDKDKELKVLSHEYELTKEKFEHMGVEKKLTESIVRSLADGLVVINNKGEVKLLNDAAGKILAEEDKMALVGKRLTDNIKDWQLISMLNGSPEDDEPNVELQSKSDDVKAAVKSSNAVIEDEYGKMVGMVAGIRDNGAGRVK